jgi:PAS domain-containing protein
VSVNDTDGDRALRSNAREGAESLSVERARIARALSEERERLRITLASIGDGVISIDAEGRVVYLNGIAEALTGWTQKEAAGHPLVEVFHIINEGTRHPVDNPALRARWTVSFTPTTVSACEKH